MIRTLMGAALISTLPVLSNVSLAHDKNDSHHSKHKYSTHSDHHHHKNHRGKDRKPYRAQDSRVFNRIATIPVCQLNDIKCNSDETFAAEIVTADEQGKTLIFSNSPANQLGFIDITNPYAPQAIGTLDLDGEPTSVASKGDYVLTAVNLSDNYVDTAGELVVVDIASRAAVAKLPLGGQPDSVAVSPDGRYAVVAIENERDEDLNDGELPQLPAGFVVVVDMKNASPSDWTMQAVDLTGLADYGAEDPEPEYVDINENNVAVVTLQENNHIVLIDLKTNEVIGDFSAGFVDLEEIDTKEESPALIMPTQSLAQVPREPDGVTWINNHYLATADEGDLNGGSRGFTIFNTSGDVVYTSGNDLDILTMTLGHYPDSRSGNKGNEPENVEFARFGRTPYLFVASERSSLLFVYDVRTPEFPLYKQALPAATAPEGVLAIPQRNLVVAASEEDSREDKMRSAINIYHYSRAPQDYPHVQSGFRKDGTPITWAALSGVSASTRSTNVLYAVDDSYFQKNRIFSMHLKDNKATIRGEIWVRDNLNQLATLPAVNVSEDDEDDSPSRINVFDSVDRARLVNEDKTVNLDLEGIAATRDGFWLVSEGAGTVGDEDRPVNSINFLIKTDRQGIIEEVVTLPDHLNDQQVRFGFEGVAVNDHHVVVALQRAWGDEDHPRLGIYNAKSKQWKFVFYPLDEVASQNGGWVGLSEITYAGRDRYFVLERDNQAGPDAAIKRIYAINLRRAKEGDVLEKHLVKDFLPLLKRGPSPVPEKFEGMAIQKNGNVILMNDNDGVEDNSGETLLLNLGRLK